MGGRCRKRWGWPCCAWPTREVIPFDFTDFTDTIRRYVEEIERLAQTQRADILERNREIDDGVFAATNDPRRPTVAPAKEPVPPFLNLAPLRNGLAALERSSEQYEKTLGHAMEGDGAGLARASLPAVNAQLIAVERTLTLPDGLPGRPWYRNQIYAPGLYTGYGVKTLPGVRESIEEKQWKLAEEQAVRVGKVLENAGEKIQSAAAAIEQAAPDERHAGTPVGARMQLDFRVFGQYWHLPVTLACKNRFGIKFLWAEGADNYRRLLVLL